MASRVVISKLTRVVINLLMVCLMSGEIQSSVLTGFFLGLPRFPFDTLLTSGLDPETVMLTPT
jgi:hypothetical protein